ncbi:hypothetical protein [Streptomyces sp. NBC_01481]|uniref:hypothetical protein n=1 Tax=Streptomyces sp. NBC_01481 TaxID=2975869 RepID=UPI0022520A90|nr:hypothetical protein [Streptomyces sp. NBC_01481]MCX4586548.1 hypothetical protein [Streptomyces sp. NBC_01481]
MRRRSFPYVSEPGYTLSDPYGGSSEQADQFFLLTEGDDPDHWPIFATADIPDSWRRLGGSTAEVVFRMLTERSHPFSTARYFDTHWFQSYEDRSDAQ